MQGSAKKHCQGLAKQLLQLQENYKKVSETLCDELMRKTETLLKNNGVNGVADEELGGDCIGHGNGAQEASNPTRTHEQLKEDVRRARAQQKGTAQRAYDLSEYLRFIQMRTVNDSHVYTRKILYESRARGVATSRHRRDFIGRNSRTSTL